MLDLVRLADNNMWLITFMITGALASSLIKLLEVHNYETDGTMRLGDMVLTAVTPLIIELALAAAASYMSPGDMVPIIATLVNFVLLAVVVTFHSSMYSLPPSQYAIATIGIIIMVIFGLTFTDYDTVTMVTP